MERIGPDGGQGTRDCYGGEGVTSVERTIPDGCYGVGNGHRDHCTFIERTIPDGCYGVGDGIGFGGTCRILDQVSCILTEKNIADGTECRIPFADRYGSKKGAVESIIADRGHGIGDGHGSKGASGERMFSDGCYGVGDGYDIKRASGERIIPDGGHRVADGNDLYVRAIGPPGLIFLIDVVIIHVTCSTYRQDPRLGIERICGVRSAGPGIIVRRRTRYTVVHIRCTGRNRYDGRQCQKHVFPIHDATSDGRGGERIGEDRSRLNDERTH